jgi:hypothetical protein
VKGQSVPQDESSSESCLHCEINELVQEHIEGQEKAGIADLAANFEEAGTWYYVVDCATCKAIIPFKHAPEDEPILCFPTMRVRCFECRTDHTYAADLVSHRKAAAPRGNFKRDRDQLLSESLFHRPHQPVIPPSHTCGGDRDASRDRQEDRGMEDSGAQIIPECEIPVSSSLRDNRDNIVIRAVNGRRATIFFLSSCFFAVAWVSQLALYIFYNESGSSDSTVLLGTAYFSTVSLALALFIFGTGTFFVEKWGFKRDDKFRTRTLCSRLASGKITVPQIDVPRKDWSD